MNKGLIQQGLIESFNKLKDNWDIYYETISLCIAEMLKYDGEMAMDMWHYILKKNENSLSTEEGTRYLLLYVIGKIDEMRHGNLYMFNDECHKVVASSIIGKPELLRYVFEKSYSAGVKGDFSVISPSVIIPIWLAYIILLAPANTVKNVVCYLYNNKNMEEVSVSDLLSMTAEVLVYLISDEDMPFESPKQEVKDSLMFSLDYIQDPVLKAECTVVIISILQL